MQRAEAHVYFSDTIGMGDWFYGTTLNDVRYQIEGYEAMFGGQAAGNELPAKVVLHFPACKGGDVVEGYGMYNYLRGLSSKGVTIETRVEGLCASIAVLVALAADTVLMADAALWMVHKPSSCGTGNADELRAEADVLDKIQAQIVGRYVARTGGKLDAATANDLINKESWLNADECITYGFVTGKLQEASLEVPTGAEAVLNYFPTTKNAPTMAITAAEKKSFFNELKEEIKSWLPPLKNEAPAPVVPPVTNATPYSVDVTGGDPMFVDTSDDGIDDIDVGDAVYSDAGLTTAYPDGDYTLADGRAVTITGGVVATLDDAAAEDSAATNAAALETANAEILALKAENALVARKLTAATNKLKAHVPGSGGAPVPAGQAQNITNKTNQSASAPVPAFTLRKN